jgi:hypothetical protein
MGRLVRGAVGRGKGGAGALESAKGGRPEGAHYESHGGGGADNYLERVIKYIPSEIVAAYVALDGIFFEGAERGTAVAGAADPAASAAAGGATMAAPGILEAFSSAQIGAAIFAICLIFTPIYIWSQSRQGGGTLPWRLQALISTIAFVIWAYATKGMIFFHSDQLLSMNVYDSRLAAAVLIFFTLVSGLFKPGATEETV